MYSMSDNNNFFSPMLHVLYNPDQGFTNQRWQYDVYNYYCMLNLRKRNVTIL